MIILQNQKDDIYMPPCTLIFWRIFCFFIHRYVSSLTREQFCEDSDISLSQSLKCFERIGFNEKVGAAYKIFDNTRFLYFVLRNVFFFRKSKICCMLYPLFYSWVTCGSVNLARKAYWLSIITTFSRKVSQWLARCACHALCTIFTQACTLY